MGILSVEIHDRAPFQAEQEFELVAQFGREIAIVCENKLLISNSNQVIWSDIKIANFDKKIASSNLVNLLLVIFLTSVSVDCAAS